MSNKGWGAPRTLGSVRGSLINLFAVVAIWATWQVRRGQVKKRMLEGVSESDQMEIGGDIWCRDGLLW